VSGGGDPPGLVVETVVTTLAPDGEPHFAAMGVVWGEETILIRPYRDTRTLRHLQTHPEAVVNVTDDVLAFAKSALTHERLPAEPAAHVRGAVLRAACHWREVAVTDIALPGASASRALVRTRVVGAGYRRPFAGFCRAKHAVVEASILASRVRYLPRAEILDGMERLAPLVEKTGGPDEREAFAFVRQYLERRAPSAGTRR
jgi:uncharacterized protein